MTVFKRFSKTALLSASLVVLFGGASGVSAGTNVESEEVESYRPVIVGPTIIVRRPPPPVYIPGPVMTVGGCDYYGCW